MHTFFCIYLTGSQSYTAGPISKQDDYTYYNTPVTTERLDDTTVRPKSLKEVLIENNLTVMEALLR